MIWSRCWHSGAICGALPHMNLAAIYKESINWKSFCYQHDISLSYGYLIIFFPNFCQNTDLKRAESSLLLIIVLQYTLLFRVMECFYFCRRCIFRCFSWTQSSQSFALRQWKLPPGLSKELVNLKNNIETSLTWRQMLWGVLPVHDSLVFMSATFKPIFPKTSHKFEHKLTQLATSWSSFMPTMTGPINKFIQKWRLPVKNHKDVKNVNKQQSFYIFTVFVLRNCCVHLLPAATYHASLSFYIFPLVANEHNLSKQCQRQYKIYYIYSIMTSLPRLIAIMIMPF